MNSVIRPKKGISLPKVSLLLREKVNLFYFLGFVPLIAIAYFNWLRAVIPLYAFILLMLKKNRLSSYGESGMPQRILGVLILFSSLFVYYAVAVVFPNLADPYGMPNYVIHLIGLFIAFFSLSALKEVFTPVFLIVSTASSYFISESLSGPLSPLLVPLFMSVVIGALQVLGMPITVVNSSSIIILHTSRGYLATLFSWGCIGVYSTMVFSIILVIFLAEGKSLVRTKLFWAAIGILGTNIVNVIRVIAIYLVDYHVGAEVGAQVHFFIGYVLFITWLALFFYAMTSRPFRKKTPQLGLSKTQDD